MDASKIAKLADVDTALVEQVFNLPQRQWEPDIHHHGKADNLR